MTLTHPSSAGPTARRGLLGPGGRRLLRAFVYTGPVPAEPPSAWAEQAEPVHDAAGAVVDWRLCRGPAATDGAADRADFRRWRDRWVTDRVIGDRAEVDGFLDWADHRCDVSLLHVLRLPEASLPWTKAARAAWQATQALATARSSGESGLGLVSGRHGGLVRGFVTCRGPVLVVGEGDVAISAADGALLLQRAGRTRRVTGWQVGDGGVTARTADGDVELGRSPAGLLLCSLAPAEHDVEVAPVPLHRMFAGIGLRVPDLARVAQAAGRPLEFRYG